MFNSAEKKMDADLDDPEVRMEGIVENCWGKVGISSGHCVYNCLLRVVLWIWMFRLGVICREFVNGLHVYILLLVLVRRVLGAGIFKALLMILISNML